jgi:PAS domain S-box-containing protein
MSNANAPRPLLFRTPLVVAVVLWVGFSITYLTVQAFEEAQQSSSVTGEQPAIQIDEGIRFSRSSLFVGTIGVGLTLVMAAYCFAALRRAEVAGDEARAREAELLAVQKALEEDVRRREDAEMLLRISQQQLNALMENSPNAIFMKGLDGRYLTVNRRFAEMHGRAREEFVGRSDVDLFAPEVAARLRLSDTRVLSSGRPIELEDSLTLADGPHTSIIHKFPLLDEEGRVHGLCGISTDISERKRAEAELRESRRQLESLLGQLPGMAFRFVNDGNFTPVYVSRGALGLTGHSARDFIESHVRFDDIVHPEDRERFRSAINAAVKRRRGFEVEYRIVDRAGHVKWVFERGQGIYDDDGRLLSIEGLAIDITQRKDAEAEKLLVERRLLEGQKLESIGVLAGGIAHDFNNLLTGVIGNANLAALELPPTSRVQQNLKQIEIASQRAAELCQQMLAYAGKGRFMVHKVEIGSLVENTVPLLRASISKRAELKFDLSPGLPPILADPTQMRQIVMNLVLNAGEALGETDGEITIRTKRIRPSPDLLSGAVLTPADPEHDHVLLEVRDTGSGMSPETMAKIFDPFFTTKFAGRGLGLAAVLGIIRSHKGGIKVSSTPGRGSTFSLLFPIVTGNSDGPAVRKNTAAPWRQEGLALIVDDEDHVRSVTAGMLKTCGLRTETARDGYEGLDLFRAKPNEYDIILLDMTMPRLSGEETLVLLREVRPDVRVLFMSGYNRREVVDSMAGTGVLSFIQKPFTLESLREQLKVMMA